MAAKDKVDKEDKDEFKEDAKLDVFENLARKEKHDIEKRRKPGEVFFGTRADRRKGEVNLQRRAAHKVAVERLHESGRKDSALDSTPVREGGRGSAEST